MADHQQEPITDGKPIDHWHPGMSASAAAVLNAYMEGYGWLDGPTRKDCLGVAAALRAAAEEIVLPKYQYADWEIAHLIMQELQAVADELEASILVHCQSHEETND